MSQLRVHISMRVYETECGDNGMYVTSQADRSIGADDIASIEGNIDRLASQIVHQLVNKLEKAL